jgi:hypothetical protein
MPLVFPVLPALPAGLLIHTAAYWLMLSLRGVAPKTSFWREGQFDTIRLCLINGRTAPHRMVTRIKLALRTAHPTRPALPCSSASSPNCRLSRRGGCPRSNPSAQPHTPPPRHRRHRKPGRRPAAELRFQNLQ